MSTIRAVPCRCSVCGAESKQKFLVSTNAFGSPDLDLRPPEMQRSTMSCWLQVCPQCGYVAKLIGGAARADREWLNSETYRTCGGIPVQNPLGKRFLKYYLTARQRQDWQAALYGAKCAAWACDDADEPQVAAFCRLLAVEAMEQLPQDAMDENLQLQKLDLLRRAGQFETVLQEGGKLRFTEPLMQKILQFQLAKAQQGDTACYRMSDADAAAL